jgi:hypothetical protein
LSSPVHLYMERLRSSLPCIRRGYAPEVCRRRTGEPTSSWTVVVGTVLWLAVGFASAVSWPRSTPAEAGTSQTGNAKVERAPQKAEETPAPPSGMSYSTRLDRTAIWVGDQFHYFITVDYSSEFEFVLDNLNKQDVNMDPFSVVDLTKKTTPLIKNRRRLLLDITLANFSLNQSDARIPQLSLYYFRRSEQTSSAEQAAAESLIVSGPTIGLRSTQPSNPADIRDSAIVVGWEGSRWIVPAVGLVALALLVALIGWELFLLIKKQRTTQAPDRQLLMAAVRAQWSSGVPSDFSDGQTIRDFFDRSYKTLKEYLSYYLGTDTAGLTAEEVKKEMQSRGTSSDVTQKIFRVLGACEAVRYSGDGMTSNPESARGVAQDIREILTLGPKD